MTASLIYLLVASQNVHQTWNIWTTSIRSTQSFKGTLSHLDGSINPSCVKDIFWLGKYKKIQADPDLVWWNFFTSVMLNVFFQR